MAVVYVAEFHGIANIDGAWAELVALPPLLDQTVAIGGSSTPSNAFNARTKIIRVHTDAICSIAVGTTPVATSSTMRLAAGQTEYFAVNAGDKIAVITNT